MAHKTPGCCWRCFPASSRKPEFLISHGHIGHCIERAVKDGAVNADDPIREFKEIAKHL
ncbi:MAG: hypothetical protein JNM61_09450 [Zoogloeaceae bacterium]|nr:hypothetical protein [Zoogloeaceae bacterium]